MNISKEILGNRKQNLERLQSKYNDALLKAGSVNEEMRIRARIDELEVQIESIKKLLNTQLIPFSPKKKPMTDVQAKKARRNKRKAKKPVTREEKKKNVTDEKGLFGI